MRKAVIKRNTKETNISVKIDLDGTGVYNIDTGIGFLNHMLESFSKHSKIDIDLNCKGDTNVDCHHSCEDIAITLGQAFRKALASNINTIVRFAHAYAPLDESLVRCVIDISGRPYCKSTLKFTREYLGKLSTEMISHFFISFANSARITIHIDMIRGINNHHIAESSFKAFALAIKHAIKSSTTTNSTKGIVDI